MSLDIRYFLKNPNRVITREEAAEHLWSDRVLDPQGRNLDNVICRIRAKIDDSGPNRFFKTVVGGYWLDVPPHHPAAVQDMASTSQAASPDAYQHFIRKFKYRQGDTGARVVSL